MSESTNIFTQPGQINQTQSKQPAKGSEYQITDSSAKQSITEPKLEPNAEQELLERYCELEQLPEGKLEEEGEPKAKGKPKAGGCGIITKRKIELPNGDHIDIVVKKDRDNAQHDSTIASELRKAAKDNIATAGNLVSRQEGLANIVLQQQMSFPGSTTETCGVQKYVDGHDALDAIIKRNHDLYREGHPNNIVSALTLSQQLLNGIYAMHEQGIVHCDLKLENIMLQNKPIALKIIDLGVSVQIGENIIGSSPNARAPEMPSDIAKESNVIATTQMDIYSAGALLCYLLFGNCKENFNSTFFQKQFQKRVLRKNRSALANL